MSVLLEALKKAAEEKQKKSDAKPEVSTPVQETVSAPSAADVKPQVTAAAEAEAPLEAVNLTFTDASMDALKSADVVVEPVAEQVTSESSGQANAEIGLPAFTSQSNEIDSVTDTVENVEMPKSDALAEDETMSPETIEPLAETSTDAPLTFQLTDAALETDTTTEEEQDASAYDDAAPLPFKLENDAEQVEETVESVDLDTQLVTQDEAESGADKESEDTYRQTPESADAQHAIETKPDAATSPVSEQSLQPLSDNEKPTSTDTVENPLLTPDAFAPTIEILDDVPPPKAEKNAEEESHDWSLDQIPGYQAQAPETETEARDKSKRMLKFSGNGSRTSLSKWALIVLLILSIVLGMGYFGLVYYEEQSEIAESQLRRYQLPKAPKVTVVKQQGTEKISLQAPDDKNTEAKASEMTSPSQNMPENQTETVVAPTVIEEAEQAAESVAQTKNRSAETAPKVTQSPKASAAPAQKLAPAKVATPTAKNTVSSEPQKVRLAISSKAEKDDAVLGYEAFERGDLSLARSHYLKAFDKNSKSLPALFGLGAVAAQKGEYYKALEYYRQILTISPYHPDAETAIAMLESQVSESRQQDKKLKSLIHKNPENARLQAAMGKRYAQKKDWVNAQEQYFKAFDLAPNNASYAINLAISLDRLGQYKLAKQYYEEGLALTNPQTAKYDTSKIKQRLRTLNQFLQREQ